MNSQTKVCLPAWIFEQAQGDTNEIKRLVLDYMKRYDGYRVIKVSKRLAICETNRI
ncbi:hypothetical protein [Rummeliibacillus stabekisii]|uniref:hypothetical protein n=1 Tax=Rummeliibacillus stabekisii TaxID=241244 RepID=UPI0037153952